ncbi:hypothetical protein OG741_01940 [Streptomyces sp. NBC_01410]|uniref:hypothetical protein n=1 Tax=Streptomyces sp. NBC_01410 TaxID=2903856 RepID=UPI0032465217
MTTQRPLSDFPSAVGVQRPMGACGIMKHFAALGAKEIEEEERRLGFLNNRLRNESDPVKAEQLRQDIAALEAELESDRLAQTVIEEEISARCGP